MLEKIPSPIGRALRGARAGQDRVTSRSAFGSAPQTIVLESEAFEDGGEIPRRFTADGDKISPPLSWRDAPAEAAALTLIIEDPDAPSLEPLVHLLAWDLPPELTSLPEGLFRSPHHDGLEENLGRNAFHSAAYLPPDPPPGHGPHVYTFQIYALDRRLNFTRPPRLKDVLAAMEGHVIAKGVLTGVYERPAA